MTRQQNILLPLELGGAPIDNATHQRVHTLADTLGVADRLDHRPAQLSGGQQQRVAIARALITSPDLLLADEPTGNLDSTTSVEVLEHLRRSARELGQTIVLVTHDHDAAGHADDVITLQDGRIA